MVKSQIFRYGLPEDFLSKSKKANGFRLSSSVSHSLVEWFLVLHFAAKNALNVEPIVHHTRASLNEPQMKWLKFGANGENLTYLHYDSVSEIVNLDRLNFKSSVPDSYF